MVRRQGIAVLAALLCCIGCKGSARRSPAVIRGEPQIRATVLTIRTTLQPANKTLTHLVVIADGRARSMNEVDGWRLIDLKTNNVTFVDAIAKSYRTKPIVSLVLARRAADAAPLPDATPPVQFVRTGARRVLQGVTAVQSLIRVGGYQRELWVGDHPLVPSNLFAVLYASEPSSSRLAPMMRAVDEAIIGMRGFPFVDHAEMPYGKLKMVVDRTVVRIEQRNVPESWLNIASDYREVKEPAAGPLPASLRPPNRSTPATESQSSSTIQKTP